MGLEPGVMEDKTKQMENGSVMARRPVMSTNFVVTTHPLAKIGLFCCSSNNNNNKIYICKWLYIYKISIYYYDNSF